MQISKFIHKDTIFFLEKSYKAEVLDTLIAKAVDHGYVTDAKTFKDAIDEREAIISTGLGDGVAIPHAKVNCVDKIFVMLGVLKPAVGWDALDQKPVNLVFLIGIPENGKIAYLQLLAQLMSVVKNADKRTLLADAKISEDITMVLASETISLNVT